MTKVYHLHVVKADLDELDGRTGVIDLYSPYANLVSGNTPNYSITKSRYGLSIPPTTWIGLRKWVNDEWRDLSYEELIGGSWQEGSTFQTDTGYVINGRFIDTTGSLSITGFSITSGDPEWVKLSIYNASHDDDTYVYDEWEAFQPVDIDSTISMPDIERYVVLDFDFGDFDIPDDFEAFIRYEVERPVIGVTSRAVRRMALEFPEWMQITELPSDEDGTKPTYIDAEENLAGSFINAISGEWIDEVSREIDYRRLQRHAATADLNQVSYAYETADLPDEVWSVRGDGVELSRACSYNEFKWAYSVYQDLLAEPDEDGLLPTFVVVDDVCWIDYDRGKLHTLKPYENLTVNQHPVHQEGYHVWNYFDEMGLFVDLERLPLESNENYRRRILDVFENRGGVHIQGLKNAIRRELDMLDDETGAPEILTMEDIEKDPKYFTPDGIPAKAENGDYPFLDLAKQISRQFTTTWGNFRWDKALWDVAGRDYAGYEMVPYVYDPELPPNKHIQAGVGDGMDLYIHHPEEVTGAVNFQWRLKARARQGANISQYPSIDFKAKIRPKGQADVYTNPTVRVPLTVEIVSGGVSYYSNIELSARSDVDLYNLEPSVDSYGQFFLFTEEGLSTITYMTMGGLHYGQDPADDVVVELDDYDTEDLDFSTDNLSFWISINGSPYTEYTFSADYASIGDLIDALNTAIDGVVFADSGTAINITNEVPGTSSSVRVASVVNPKGSGFTDATGSISGIEDLSEVDARIPTSEVESVTLHKGRFEVGLIDDTDDPSGDYEIWFSNDDATVLDDVTATIEHVWDGSAPYVVMKSLVTFAEPGEWHTDWYHYDIKVNGKPPYDQPTPAVVRLPAVLWPEYVSDRGFEIQLLTTNTLTDQDGERITQYGAITANENDESTFATSDIILVNGATIWDDKGYGTIGDGSFDVEFSSAEYGLFPSESLFPSDELYPLTLTYPLPAKAWQQHEYYLLDSNGEPAVFSGLVDENGPWRHGEPQKEGNTNYVLHTMEALTKQSFGIQDPETIIDWIGPELVQGSNVVLWQECNIVKPHDPPQDKHYPPNAIQERVDNNVYYYDSFRVLARLKGIDSRWYPKLNSGYFYTGTDEYYVYADKQEVDVNAAEVILDHNVRQGAPLAITGGPIGTALQLTGEVDSYARTDADNLIESGSAHFHRGFGDWVIAAGSVDRSTEPELAGQSFSGYVYSMDCTEDSAFIGTYINQEFECEPEEQYTFSFRVKTDFPARIRTRFRFQTDGSDQVNRYSNLYADLIDLTPVSAHQWTEFHHTALSGFTSNQMRVTIDIAAQDGNVPVGANIQIDRPSLKKGLDAEFSPSIRINNDIDLRVRTNLSYKANTGQSTLLSVAANDSDDFSYRLYLTAGNLLRLQVSDGTDKQLISSTVPVPVTDEAIWLRATLRLDIGGGTRQVRFSTSSNGLFWSLLGNPVNATGPSYISTSGSMVTLGADYEAGINRFTGPILQAEIRDGVDGFVVAAPNFTQTGPWPLFGDDTRQDAQGNEWAITGEGTRVFWDQTAPDELGRPSEVELRQTAFMDPDADRVQLSLYNREELTVKPDGAVYVGYPDVYSVTAVDEYGEPIECEEYSFSNRIEVSADPDTKLTLTYRVNNSYYVDYDHLDAQGNQKAKVVFDSEPYEGGLANYHIVYEASFYDPASVLKLPLNPLYTTQNSGFIFLSQNEYPIRDIRVHVSPSTLVADGKDYLMVTLRSEDLYSNPKPYQHFAITTSFGVYGKVGDNDGQYAADADSDKLYAEGHGLSVGDAIVLRGESLPEGLEADTSYYVVDIDVEYWFKLSDEIGGEPIQLITNGTDNSDRIIEHRTQHVVTDDDGFAVVTINSELNPNPEAELDATGYITVSGTLSGSAQFNIAPPELGRPELHAKVANTKIYADETSLNAVYGKVFDAEMQPVSGLEVTMKRKRGIWQLFAEDREGIRMRLDGQNNTKLIESNILSTDSAHFTYDIGTWEPINENTQTGVEYSQVLYSRMSLQLTRLESTGVITAGPGTFEVEEDQWYTFLLSSFAPEHPREFSVELHWYDENDEYISYDWEHAQEALGKWVENSIQRQAPTGAAYVRPRIGYGACFEGESHYVDRVLFGPGEQDEFVPSVRFSRGFSLRISFSVEELPEEPMAVFGSQFGVNNVSYALVMMPSGHLKIATYDLMTYAVQYSGTGDDFRVEPGTIQTLSVHKDTVNGTNQVHRYNTEYSYWQDIGVYSDYVGGLLNGPSTVGSGDLRVPDTLEFQGDLHYASLREGEQGVVVAEFDATESGPWSPDSDLTNQDNFGQVWQIQPSMHLEEESSTVDLRQEVEETISDIQNLYGSGTVSVVYAKVKHWLSDSHHYGCNVDPGLAIPGEELTGFALLLTQNGVEYYYMGSRPQFYDMQGEPVVEGTDDFGPIQCEGEWGYDPESGATIAEHYYVAHSSIVVENDNTMATTTEDDGSFTFYPITSMPDPGYWFASVESEVADKPVGDVVFWLEAPVALAGIENPGDIYAKPLQLRANANPVPYARTMRSLPSYEDDATIDEDVDVEFNWLPPKWYAITAYKQYLMDIADSGHYVQKLM